MALTNLLIASPELLLSDTVIFCVLYFLCLTSGVHRDADRAVSQTVLKYETCRIHHDQNYNSPLLAHYTVTSPGHRFNWSTRSEHRENEASAVRTCSLYNLLQDRNWKLEGIGRKARYRRPIKTEIKPVLLLFRNMQNKWRGSVSNRAVWNTRTPENETKSIFGADAYGFWYKHGRPIVLQLLSSFVDVSQP